MHVRTYICMYIMLRFQLTNRLAFICTTYMHTYTCIYMNVLLLYVHTVLLSLSRTVHTCIRTYVRTYLFRNVKIYVHTYENLCILIYAI